MCIHHEECEPISIIDDWSYLEWNFTLECIDYSSSSLQLSVNPEDILRVYFLISRLIISISERAVSFFGPFYSSKVCFSFLRMLLNRFLTLFSVRLLRSSLETSDHFFPFSIIKCKRLKSSLSLHGPLGIQN